MDNTVREVYDQILDRIEVLSKSDPFRSDSDVRDQIEELQAVAASMRRTHPTWPVRSG